MGKKKSKKMRSHVQIGEAAALEMPLASPVKAKTPASRLGGPPRPLFHVFMHMRSIGLLAVWYPVSLQFCYMLRSPVATTCSRISTSSRRLGIHGPSGW